MPLTKLSSSLEKGRPSPPLYVLPLQHRAKFTTLFKAHRAVMVLFLLPLHFSDSSFHFHVCMRARGYRCPASRNLSVCRLRSRQLLGDKEEGCIRKLRCKRFCGAPGCCRRWCWRLSTQCCDLLQLGLLSSNVPADLLTFQGRCEIQWSTVTNRFSAGCIRCFGVFVRLWFGYLHVEFTSSPVPLCSDSTRSVLPLRKSSSSVHSQNVLLVNGRVLHGTLQIINLGTGCAWFTLATSHMATQNEPAEVWKSKRCSLGSGWGSVGKAEGREGIQQGSDGDAEQQEHPQLFLCHGYISAAENERKKAA